MGGHPWVAARDIHRVDPMEAGSVEKLFDADHRFIGVGTYHPRARFPFRVFSRADEPLDQAFFVKRFEQAIELRSRTIFGTNAQRVVFSEADGVPGLIVDSYAGHLVVQVRTLGMDLLRAAWLKALIEVFEPESIYEKSNMAARAEEGLEDHCELLYGELPDEVWIREDDLQFRVPILEGPKTGFYADQRNSRRMLGGLIQPGDQVLDCFCFSGGFAMHAAANGAKVVGVDMSDIAIATAKQNSAANGLSVHWVQANAFEFLDQDANQFGPYDWIVLDPPAIAKSSASRNTLQQAIKKLVQSAVPHLVDGGRVIVCNCSFQVTLNETLEAARLGAMEVGSNLVLEGATYQDLDHPAPLHFPESLYLKCAWLRKQER